MRGIDPARACLITLACASCTGDETFSGGVLIDVPSGLELWGTATVAPGLEGEGRVLHVVRARAGLSLKSIVCDAQTHRDNGEVLLWKRIGSFYQLKDSSLEWRHAAPNFDSQVRVYAVLVSEQAGITNPPLIQPGDPYGATSAIEVRICESPLTAESTCPLDPTWWHWPPIQLRVAFAGCGARAGRCTFDDDPGGRRCQSWSSTLPSIAAPYEQACAESGGTYFPHHCPREALVGGCRYDLTHPDGSTLIDWYYAPRSASQVAAICEWQNKFFQGPPD